MADGWHRFKVSKAEPEPRCRSLTPSVTDQSTATTTKPSTGASCPIGALMPLRSGMLVYIHAGPNAGKRGRLLGRWTYPFDHWVIRLEGGTIENAVSVPPTHVTILTGSLYEHPVHKPGLRA